MDEAALLPVFLKLAGRKVVVVGGGPVAAAKIGSLEGSGAEILVVAPELRQEILSQAGAGRLVQIAQRAFRAEDLDGAWLVIAAAPPEVNRQVAAAAAERRIFVVAADDPAACSAYGAGSLRRAGVTVAVSTDGRAPALAGLLREGLDAVVPGEDEMAVWVAQAQALRTTWKANRVPMAQRRPQLLEALLSLYQTRGKVP